MDSELWKDIEGYEGLYQISNHGRVKSLNYNHTCCEQILVPVKHHTNYLTISLYKNGVKQLKLIHRLVANAFIENPNNYSCVNHKDENKLNNDVENLEWCTHKYNSNYGTRNKRISEKGRIMVNQYTLDGVLIKTWNSLTEISKTLHIPIGNICECCKGVYKTTHGYIWKYKS